MKHTGLRNLLIFSVAILLGLALAACGGGKYRSELLRAESILDSLPDSAARILEKVSCNKLENCGDSALFALLQAETEYKLYIENADGDSLLSEAEEYFRSKGDRPRLMRTLFQRGIKQYYDGDYTESFISGLKGLEIAEELENTEYLAKINEHIGDIYCNSCDSETGLIYTRKAIEYYKIAGRDRNVIFARIDAANDLYNVMNYKEALALLDSVSENIPAYDSSAMCYLLGTKIDGLLACDSLTDVRRLHNKLLMLSVGNYTPDLDQALEVAVRFHDKRAADSLKQVLQSTCKSWEDNSRSLRVLSKYHSFFGTPDSALIYAEKRMSLEHKGLIKILKQGIDKVHTETYKNRAKAADSNAVKAKILAVGGVTLLLTVIVLIVYFSYRKENKLKNNIKKCVSEISHQVDTINSLNLQNKELLEDSERNKDTIYSLNTSLLSAANDRQDLIVSVTERLYSLNILCRAFFSEKKSVNAVVLKLYSIVEKEILKIKEDKCLSEIEKIIDFTQGGLATYLKTYMPKLKKDDYIFILFSYLHFSSKTLCILCDIEESYYPKKRKRLKDKIADADIPEYIKQRLTDF